MFRRKLVSLLATLGVIAGGLAVANVPAAAAPTSNKVVDSNITPMKPPQRTKNDVVLHSSIRVSKKAPPTSGAVSKLLGTSYWYAGAAQNTSGLVPAITNVYANVGGSATGPYLDTTHDAHTLVEHAVRRVPGSNAGLIEVGFTNDPAVYGDTQRRLFVYEWDKNGVGQGYNNNFTLWSGRTNNPGDVITGTMKVGWHYNAGAWWLALGTNWVGYFIESTLWPGITFNTVGEFIGFTETAQKSGGTRTFTCSDQGNGLDSANASAMLYSSVTYNGSGTGVNMVPYAASSGYTTTMLSLRSYRTGGPGLNSTGGSPGNTGSC